MVAYWKCFQNIWNKSDESGIFRTTEKRSLVIFNFGDLISIVIGYIPVSTYINIFSYAYYIYSCILWAITPRIEQMRTWSWPTWRQDLITFLNGRLWHQWLRPVAWIRATLKHFLGFQNTSVGVRGLSKGCPNFWNQDIPNCAHTPTPENDDRLFPRSSQGAGLARFVPAGVEFFYHFQFSTKFPEKNCNRQLVSLAIHWCKYNEPNHRQHVNLKAASQGTVRDCNPRYIKYSICSCHVHPPSWFNFWFEDDSRSILLCLHFSAVLVSFTSKVPLSLQQKILGNSYITQEKDGTQEGTTAGEKSHPW